MPYALLSHAKKILPSFYQDASLEKNVKFQSNAIDNKIIKVENVSLIGKKVVRFAVCCIQLYEYAASAFCIDF